MRKIYCIVADGRVCHVVEKKYLDDSLSAWRGVYKNAESVPAEEVIDTSKPVLEQVRELFTKMDYHYEIWDEDDGSICIDIRWGDWKHDHENADYIMETAFGLKVTEEAVTEENGEDAYSAIHTYKPARARKRKAKTEKSRI